ncbi:FHA domain-containing protein [Herbiconiux daphne]|uniref:FHA domain-containing protein n=1 Tax=Herbiconiux daphne TaxID=2970914 RepID=A0ABT2H108_9MICO|nr:FHA domain-containing protein [Herbiconiux daphne]MCS5733611.1 FHA domain-containing protein [Herbiconiux daphne]
MGSLRFVPADGEWTVLAAWPTVVTISARASEAVVQAIWKALDAPDAALEPVVSSIPIRTAPDLSFSVVRFEPGDGVEVDPAHPPLDWTATVVARGVAAVDLLSVGGSRRFGSGGAEPWALGEFPAVTGISTGALPPVPESSVRVPADARGLDRGIAHASRVLWAASAADMVNERSTHRPGETTAEPTAETAAGRTTARTAESSADPSAESSVRDADPSAGNPAGDADPAARDLAGDADPAGGETVAAAGFAPADLTLGSLDLADIPPQADIRPEPQPYFELKVGDEPTFELTGAVVIGRNPQPRRTVSSEPQTLIAVPSPDHEVSANHVEIARSGRTVVVTDLRSTNGTTVRVHGRPTVRLRQGDSVVASGSAIVEIGDGNVIHIVARERGITGITL